MSHPDDGDIRLSQSTAPTLSDMLASGKMRRRTLLKSALGAGAAALFGQPLARKLASAAPSHAPLAFRELVNDYPDSPQVPSGYDMQVLLRWGDPIFRGAPDFDVRRQSAASQRQQFGYNNDFLSFMPRLQTRPEMSNRGLLCINHEYTIAHLMFPGLEKKTAVQKVSREQVDIEIAAHGHSVVEIYREGQEPWKINQNSIANRRIMADTPMKIAGPAAGHARMRTPADPTGNLVLGTFANCAGGWTPWGTILIAEENFNGYFMGDIPEGPEKVNHKRYGLGGKPWYGWGRFYERFATMKTPNEPNRFGWIVEYDPYNPNAMPVKRTSLGRFKHEGCTTVLNHDGRVVAYSGDDQRFDYLYKWVSKGKFNTKSRRANRDLLDDGTLYVAKFSDDYSVKWMPLVFGDGPLTPANGFRDQGEVLIETRRAADLLGATPMDRPEDVETNPVNGRVYVALTNNSKRKDGDVNKANPRAKNYDGQIMELVPPKKGNKVDHAALEHAWDMFIIAGDPQSGVGAWYPKAPSRNGWLSSPDNVTFDNAGRIWIATDGMNYRKPQVGDGLFAAETTGPDRGRTQRFFTAPKGAEVCGPMMNPDNTSLFLCVQHPGDDKGSSYYRPSTRWPDFGDSPPRPSVVVVTKKGGGVIGT
jgi:secreted PhoX family phosphatase